MKLVKTWAEVGSRNLPSWWQKVIFSTQENILNPLPYVARYDKTFRAVDLFKKPIKKPYNKKPRLLLSLHEGIPNEYSRVWPLIGKEEFVAERAIITSQLTHSKGKGLQNTLLSITKKASQKEFLKTPPRPRSNLKRNQAVRGSPLETAETCTKQRRNFRNSAENTDLPVKLPKPTVPRVCRTTRVKNTRKKNSRN